MKRLSWSKLLSLAALVSLGVVTNVARADNSVTPRIPGTLGSNLAPANSRAIFEGPAATDFFNSSPIAGLQNATKLLANPQIATGPEDLLLAVNSQIVRIPNGNAAGVIPTSIYPQLTSVTGGQANGYQKAFLDNWLGTSLDTLCPTGANGSGTRDGVSCQFDNLTVTYDQMQGRFLVLFTVTDTGVVLQPDNTYSLQNRRKSSWVLIVSRFAILADQACLQGTNAQPGCPPGPPVQGPNPAGTFVFVTPTPPQGSNIGGVNTTLWTIYSGVTGDGFGGIDGNINALPGIAAAAASFDCRPGAVYAAGAIPSTATVCYMPTGARLGVDNDTVTITSPVINANIPNSELNATLDPATFRFPAYAGNRVRVIKKTAIYTQKAPLVAGNQFASGFASRSGGDYYDLFTTAAGAPVGTATPVDTGVAAGNPPAPWTVMFNNTVCTPGNQSFAGTACDPIFYEPAHLRGRPMATFSNSPSSGSQTYLVGSRPLINNAPFLDTAVYIQGVREIYSTIPAILTGAIPFYPVLQTGSAIGAEPNGNGTPSPAPVSGFFSPSRVTQLGSTITLFVGDARTHKLIFREGHLYEARVASAAFPALTTFSGNALSTTVFYDIFQKLSAGTGPATIYNYPSPVNGTPYAPMFDVPADVRTYGQFSNPFFYLENANLFAATTYPPLSGFPDNTAQVGDPFPAAGDPRSRITFGNTGLAATQLPTSANCYNSQLTPGAPGPNDAHAWASLFDVRCGTDVTDSFVQYRDPQSGALTTTGNVVGVPAYTIRGDSGIDPNDGSMWVYGAYAQKRNVTTSSNAHWGTFGANYKMTVPGTGTLTQDSLNNAFNLYTDIAGIPEAPYILIAANVGLAPNLTVAPPGTTTLPFGTNAIVNPGPFGPGQVAPGTTPAAGKFGPDDVITRREMAAWIVKSQMDEAAITSYLTATGGLASATFADVPPTDTGYRYIEVMARRNYTSGCAAGVARRYCPDWISTRRDLAAFMIRAKMGNVFPTVLSGCTFGFVNGTTPPGPTPSLLFPPAITTNCGGTVGDNFALYVPGLNYFNDNPAVTGNDWFVFIQKLRELHITIGTSLGPVGDGRNGAFNLGLQGGAPPMAPLPGSEGNLSRKQIAVFMVRGFFF